MDRFLAGLALLVGAVAACGGQRLPPPPPYTPESTPEPETACPRERDAAKAARERALGAADATVKAAAAEAVFAHAACEHRQFESMQIESVDVDLFKASIRDLKGQLFTVKNLYDEVTSYNLPHWSVGAYTRLGNLYAGYAAKLRASEPGPGIDDPGQRSTWRQEVDALARPVDLDAAAFYGRALEIADLGPDAFRAEAPMSDWIRAACAGLGRIDRAGPGRYRSCAR